MFSLPRFLRAFFMPIWLFLVSVILASPAALSYASTIPSHPTSNSVTTRYADIYFGQPADDAPYKPEKEPAWRQFIGGDVEELWAYSPSMDRTIPLILLRADSSNGPRPLLYLLNGGDGGENTANWLFHTDVLEFYRSKNINVLIPMMGYRSFYTDWIEDNPQLGGKQYWETFLTQELPTPLEHTIGTNGKRAIAGNSMSATTVVLYAQHNPGFYDAIASISGCQQTSGFLGLLATSLTISTYGKPLMMWGEQDSPTWAYNDIFANIEKLRNQKMYIASGSGTFGPYDLAGSPFLFPGVTSVDSVVNGGIIEAVSNMCTHNFKAKLDQAGIPAVFNFAPVGTHSWGYWQDYIHDSWRVIGPALEA